MRDPKDIELRDRVSDLIEKAKLPEIARSGISLHLGDSDGPVFIKSVCLEDDTVDLIWRDADRAIELLLDGDQARIEHDKKEEV